MTKQPVWKFIANLGDTSPLEYGGYFIFEDTTKVYPPEAELYLPDENIAYRFILDRMELWSGHLIPYGFSKRSDLPYPIEKYIEWFDNDIPAIASFMGIDPIELQYQFTSFDPLVLAIAYKCLGDYMGMENLDEYPLTLTRREAKKRYSKYIGGNK